MIATDVMTEQFNLSLTADERTELLAFLEQALPGVLVEVHRTESPDFRELVQHKETALRNVIDKLRRL